VKQSSILSVSASRIGNCRNMLRSSRIRKKEELARVLENQWHELLVHATIEEDPEKMLRLTAELEESKRRTEATGKRNSRS